MSWSDLPYIGNNNQCFGKPPAQIFQKAKSPAGYRFFKIPREKEKIISYLSKGTPVIVGIVTSKNMDLNGYRATFPNTTPCCVSVTTCKAISSNC